LRVFILSFLFFINVLANDVMVSSSILTTSENLDIKSVMQSDGFEDTNKNHINLGFDATKTIWLKLKLTNSSNKNVDKYLVVNNPLLEEVFFYDAKNDFKVSKSGLLHVKQNRQEIFPAQKITIEPHKMKLVYVKVKNTTTTLQFGFELLDKKEFNKDDKIKQFSIMLFIGLLSAFVIYSLMLFFYTTDSSYYLYAFYLLTLMFQQLTYVGFLPLYAPSWFVHLDNLLVVLKVSLMIVASALFAKNFLKMEEFLVLNKIYKIFIAVVLVQIPFFGTQFFYVPEVTVFLGLLFIVFNTYSGIYVYTHGNRQARFFLVGWMFLFIGYMLMIFDALGFISIMNSFPELILWITVVEAVFLMLAFVDKLNILTTQKKELNQKLFEEMYNRQKIVEAEVVERTNDLEMALEEKVVLFRELNHRVKNNLQLILSIIRLQRFDLKNNQSIVEFEKLENRIKAISKTHELLCDSEDIVEIDMREYIDELYNELSESIIDKDIDFDLEVYATMFLRQAVYVGLIINELISNSIKHAFSSGRGKISITLYKQKDEYLLTVGDSGDGYDTTSSINHGLGLKLVNSLVINQLEGSLHAEKNELFQYNIKFKVR